MTTVFSAPLSDADRAAQALDRLGTLHPKLIDLSLDRVWRLLKALGNPQDRLAPVVHVAGTNGKGSTVAVLRSCLEAAGLKVHAYTSPHLVRFNERIRVAGEIISDKSLADCLEEVERVNNSQPITFFEVTTCAAFLAFAQTPADVVLLETGLGGRLDATNVVARPAVTVLTPIGMDHEQFLGNTLDAIAMEKAHIIKEGVPCISARQEPAALAVIAERTREMNAPLVLEGRDFAVHADGQGATGADGMVFETTTSKGPLCWHLPASALPGEHQMHNAAVSVAALLALMSSPLTASWGMADVAQGIVDRGLKTVSWPARMQRLTHGPLVDHLPEGWELWLDGAHNPQAGQMLAQFLDGWKDRPLDIIMGMMGPKDARGFFRPLVQHVRRLRAIPVPQEPNAKLPEAVAEAAEAEGVRDVSVATDALAALKTLVGETDQPRRVLICGSLYLAGALLGENG